MQKLTNLKTLLGPGYYNVNYGNKERTCPSFSFEQVNTLTFKSDTIANYDKEMKQIKTDR